LYNQGVTGAIERVLTALNAANIRYLIVGGVAVVLHGHLRTTADLDLVVQLQAQNIREAIAALVALGYRPRAPVDPFDFADRSIREQWISEKGLAVFSLWSPNEPTLEVDLFVEEPFDFDQAYARAIHAPLDKTTASVASLEDLIATKRRSGRPEDLADITALEAISQAMEEDND
jgi:hypothetical protein